MVPLIAEFRTTGYDDMHETVTIRANPFQASGPVGFSHFSWTIFRGGRHSGIDHSNLTQGQLFDCEQHEKQARLDEVLDELHDSFGQGAVKLIDV